jgi:hypothetical protein
MKKIDVQGHGLIQMAPAEMCRLLSESPQIKKAHFSVNLYFAGLTIQFSNLFFLDLKRLASIAV